MNEEGNNKNNRTDRLDDLEKRLYSRDEDFIDATKKDYHNLDEEAPASVKNFWPNEKTPKGRPMPKISTNMKLNFLKNAFIVALITFVVALGIFVFVLFGDRNTVSAKNILVDIVAPTEIAGGEEINFYINIENKNNTKILDADLIIDFPTGTVIKDENGNPVKRWRENLGDIGIGEKITKKYNPIFFGEEGQHKSIGISIEYKIAGSNALVSKDLDFDFIIKSSPVVVTVTGPAEVSPNSEATYDIIVRSKNLKTIEDVSLMISYSFGFEPISFDPKPSFGSDRWNLGDLGPESERKISVTGKFTGFEGDQKILSVLVGSGQDKNTGALETLFLEKQISVNLTAPFLAISFIVNNSFSDEPVVKPESTVNVSFVVKNNLSSNLSDLEVKAKIYGGMHLESTIEPENGFYRSLDKTLIWNQKTNSDLAVLGSGQTKRIKFSFKLKDSATYGTNNKFNIEATVGGLKERSGYGLERISLSGGQAIKLASTITSSVESLYNQGPFSGVGFIPPKVDNETYYTIHFNVGNSANDLRDVVMRANLPVYVKWVGEYTLFGTEIKYSPLDNNIVWEAGNISAGQSKDLYFRVLFVPSLSQVGREVVLVRSISGEGVDDFSGKVQRFKIRNVTTRASDVNGDESMVVND